MLCLFIGFFCLFLFQLLDLAENLDTDELMAYLGPNTAHINDNLSEVNSSLSAVADGIVSSMMMVRSQQQNQQQHQLPSELDNVQLCQPLIDHMPKQQQQLQLQQQQQQQQQLDNLNSSNVNVNLVATNPSHDLVNDDYVLFT